MRLQDAQSNLNEKLEKVAELQFEELLFYYVLSLTYIYFFKIKNL